ncbi:MAG: DUF1800 domain-containing protein [Actinomycetia bacterium]|nr:DUF1800 domain-containing protein [Actinomycetes bacterium]
MTPPTRRQVLQLAGAVGVAGGVALATGAAPANAATASRPGRDFVPADQHLHLLRRATYGPTPASFDYVKAKGITTWLDQQLSPGTIDDSTFQRQLHNKFPWLSWSIPDVIRRVPEGGRWPFMTELSMATISRATWSKRQLFEVMCEFWSNHLHITCPSDKVWFARHDYDATVIRKHALGTFEDMLIASAKHPAMLVYLNNAESSRDNPNENYGREVLELHTVGIDGGYTEKEMFDSALIMTGFTLRPDTQLYAYDEYAHYTGQVSVLGFDRANTKQVEGEQLGIDYLRHLARHPATARHLSRKLWVRFISDTPDDTFVDELAQVYLNNGTAIEPMLRYLFLSDAFAASVGQKMRRPYEDVIATLRLLGYRQESGDRTDGLRTLHWMVTELGQAPHAWGLPDGYPDEGASWLSAGSTLNRWNRHLSLASHWGAEELPMPPLRSLLPAQLPRNYGDMVDDLARRLVFRTIEDRHKKVILSFLDRRASDPFDRRDAEALYRMGPAVALILDSPYHGVR